MGWANNQKIINDYRAHHFATSADPLRPLRLYFRMNQ
jgi:hypothetical protein